nr:RNA-directed DNA polymerase, eukaryota [Tanacetum cinerariifolium]
VNNEEEESDSEAVSDTYFGDNGDAQERDNKVDQTLNYKEVSKDPFKIYDLLNRHNKEVGNSGIESSIPYPPGFTPRKENVTFEQKAQEVQGEECIRSQHSSRVFKEVEKSDINIQSDGRVIMNIRKKGGSILDTLDEMVKWNRECMVMGDFNEVRCKEDRWGSTFHAQGAISFNSFISNSGFNEV